MPLWNSRVPLPLDKALQVSEALLPLRFERITRIPGPARQRFQPSSSLRIEGPVPMSLALLGYPPAEGVAVLAGALWNSRVALPLDELL